MSRYRIVKFSIILALFFTSTGCSSLNKMLGDTRPDASIIGASLTNLDAQSATVTFDVQVDNPYGVELPVLGLDFGLSSGGQQFMSGALNDQGTIPARGNRTLPVVAKIPFQDALRVLSGLRPGAVVPYDAQIGLNLDVPAIGDFRIPLNRSGEFPIPAIPQISIDDFKWESLGLTGAVANIMFNLGNTNQFPVSLENLGYDFELAGQKVFQGAVQDRMNLAPGEDGKFGLRLALSPGDIGLAALNMLRGSEANFGFVGNALLGSQFGDINLPVDNRGKTKMRR